MSYVNRIIMKKSRYDVMKESAPLQGSWFSYKKYIVSMLTAWSSASTMHETNYLFSALWKSAVLLYYIYRC